MKRISLLCLAAAATTLLFMAARRPVQGQDGSTRGRAPVPHKTAVVDVAYVLSNCKRLESDLKQLEELARTKKVKFDELVQQAQAIAEEIKTNKLIEGTEEFSSREEAFIRVESRGKSYAELANKELNRKYALAHIEAYQELRAALERFAQQNGYTLIINARREPTSADNPREMARTMAQFVTWHDGQDDLTEAVLNYLNRRYEAAGANTSPARSERSNNSPAGAPRGSTAPPARKSAK